MNPVMLQYSNVMKCKILFFLIFRKIVSSLKLYIEIFCIKIMPKYCLGTVTKHSVGSCGSSKYSSPKKAARDLFDSWPDIIIAIVVDENDKIFSFKKSDL